MKTNPVTPGLRLAMKRFDEAYLEVKRQFMLLEEGGDQDLSNTPVNETLVQMNNEVDNQEAAGIREFKSLIRRLDMAIEQGHTTREESGNWSVPEMRAKVDAWGIPTVPVQEMPAPEPWNELKQRITLAQMDGLIEPGALEGVDEKEAMAILDGHYVPRNSKKVYSLKERLDVAKQMGMMSSEAAELLYQDVTEDPTAEKNLSDHLDALNIPTLYPRSQFVLAINNDNDEAVFCMVSGTLDKPEVGFMDISAILDNPTFPILSRKEVVYSPIQGAAVWRAMDKDEIQFTTKSVLLNGRTIPVYQSRDVTKIMELLSRK